MEEGDSGTESEQKNENDGTILRIFNRFGRLFRNNTTTVDGNNNSIGNMNNAEEQSQDSSDDSSIFSDDVAFIKKEHTFRLSIKKCVKFKNRFDVGYKEVDCF